MNHQYRPIYISFFIAVLILIIPLLSAAILFNYNQTRDMALNSFSAQQTRAEKNVIKTLEMVNDAYQMLDQSLNDQLEKGFEIFLEAYEEADRNPENIDLFRLKRKLGGYTDLYIINQQGVIQYTTYSNDLYLDFSQWPEFYSNITRIRLGDQYSGDLINKEIKTGMIRKFAYMPTPDHRYILELGLRSDAFSKYMKNLDMERVVDELIELNSALVRIRIFDENFDDVLDNAYQADDQTSQIIGKLFKNKGSHTIIKTNQRIENKYIYVNINTEEYASRANRVIQLQYSYRRIDSKLEKQLKINIIFFLAALFASIILSFLTSLVFSRPIHKIIQDMNLISEGDLDHLISIKTKNELKLLEHSANTMIEKMRAYIQQIKKNEKKIKIDNDELEVKVQDRTKKLEKLNFELSEKNKILRREILMAQNIQSEIIPKDFPKDPRIDFFGLYLPMEDVGGDYYDVFEIDKNHIGILISDVSGHGVPAALVTMMAKISFTANSKKNLHTGQITELVNHDISNVIGEVINYLTAFYAIINLQTQELEYTSAGHNEVFVVSEDGEIRTLHSNSTFIGSFDEMNYPSFSIKLKNRDKLVLYTDGIPESKNKEDEFLTCDGLKRLIKNHADSAPQEMAFQLLEDLKAFQGSDKPNDDITLFITQIHRISNSSI